MKKSFTLDESLHLADKLSQILHTGDILLFEGDLGAGKTTIIRKVIQQLVGDNIDVPSPTFTLVQTYDSPKGQLWHFDLYRLENPDEVLELGIDDAFHEGISFIEWPDRLGNLKPNDSLLITLTQGIHPDERSITLTPSMAWRSRIKNLA